MSALSALLPDADAAVKRSFQRCWTHFRSELTPNLDGVMATIVKDEDAGETPVFWVMPGEPDASGRVPLQICPGWSGAREVYRGLFEQMRMVDATMVLQISTPSWCFHHAVIDFEDLQGTPVPMECAVIIRTDAEAAGVTGEMACVLDGGAPPAHQTAKDRLAFVHDHARSLGRGDIEAVLATMTEDVQAVGRDRFSSEAGRPALIDGKAAMRHAYGELLDEAKIIEVIPVQWYVNDPRYILMDLHWTLELNDSGERVHSRTVEVLSIAPDGRVATRMGWGSPLN